MVCVCGVSEVHVCMCGCVYTLIPLCVFVCMVCLFGLEVDVHMCGCVYKLIPIWVCVDSSVECVCLVCLRCKFAGVKVCIR